MKILLINSNPVVSRLTALSARKEDIQIDEIQEINELNNKQYDIVFVDADSWNKDVDTAISENIETQKKVLFYAQDDKSGQDLFDMSILKPFLPSEVSAIIRSIEAYNVESLTSTEVEEETHFDILENSKNDKKDEPLNSLEMMPLLDEEKVETVKDEFSNDKFDLDDTLFDDLDLSPLDDKVEEKTEEKSSLSDKSFEEQLEEAFPLDRNAFDELTIDEPKSKDDDLSLKNEEDFFELEMENTITEKEDLAKEDLSKENLLKEDSSKEDVVNEDATTNKEIKTEEDVLDFDLDNKDEFDLDLEEGVLEEIISPREEKSEEMASKKEKSSKDKDTETKILDKSEVANIKDILENDAFESDELETLMTPSVSAVDFVNEKKEKKKKSKNKDNSTASIQSDALIETLSSVPVETLKVLLSGATVKVSIKFPKAK